jgi:hypothetical protein
LQKLFSAANGRNLSDEMMRPDTWKTWLFLLVIFFVTIGIRFYWINHKAGLNVDEGLSISVSSINKYMLWNDNYESGRIYTGKELKAISLWGNDPRRNAIKDVYRLHINNNGDTPHTSLYYSCLRLWFAGRATSDYREIIRIGTTLNLLFFSISFIVMYQLLKLLFDENFVILAGLLLCFLNTGSISNTLVLRPYQLQETSMIVAAYCCTVYHRKILDGTTFDTWRNLVLLASAGAFTLLSGYFSIIYYALVGCLIVSALMRRGRLNQIGFFVAVVVFSIGLAQTVYTSYLDGIIHSSRSGEGLDTLGSNEIASRFMESIAAFVSLSGTYIFYWPLIICLGVALVVTIIPQTARHLALATPKHERNAWMVAWFLVASSVIFSVTALYLAPYKFLRYIMPVFPIMALLNPIILRRLKPRVAVGFVCVMVAVCLFYALDTTHIENLSLEKPEIFSFRNKPEIPVLIFNKQPWKYADMIPYLADNQRYEFPSNEEELEVRIAQLPNAFVILENGEHPGIRTQRASFLGRMNFFDLYEVKD